MLNMEYLPVPISVNWNLTNLCNFECQHCYSKEIREKLEEMTNEEVTETIRKLKKDGVQFITFGGGESLLRKDIWNILEECNRNGIEFRIITNGYALDDNTCEKLKKFNIMELLISLDGPCAKIHDNFRNKKGSFDKVISSIKLAQKYQIEIMVLTNINSYNKMLISEFCDLIEQLGIKKWRVNEIKELGNGDKNSEKLLISPSELKKCHEQIYEFEKRGTCSILYDSVFAIYDSSSGYEKMLPGCHCGRMSLCIRANGDVLPCVYYNKILGNVKKQSLLEIWEKSEELQLIRDKKAYGKCQTCKDFLNCRGGCFARTYLHYGDINHPDPLCWRNEK